MDDSNDNRRYPAGYDVKIPVTELRVGMHVTRLDRDWLETPFLVQGFYIKTADDIVRVAEYCQHVWIQGKGTAGIFDIQVDFESGQLIGRKPVQYPITATLEEEHARIREFVGEMRDFTRKLMDDVRFGAAIDVKGARQLVSRNVESVLRHPDALLWISRMRQQSGYTAEHLLNVCILSIAFGRQLGLKKQQLQNLGLCGLLHDVGKTRIPLEILNKPERLSTEEFKIMRTHPDIGRQLLSAESAMLQSAVDVAFGHHERIDGNGYPRRVRADSLSLFTRIVSIVDAFDAMTGHRVYCPAKSSSGALRVIFEERGKQFDENLALAFIQTIGVYPVGSIVELACGAVGVVVEANRRYRHLPRLMMLLDKDKKSAARVVVDLTEIEAGKLPKDFFIRRIVEDGSFGLYLSDLYDKGALPLWRENPPT